MRKRVNDKHNCFRNVTYVFMRCDHLSILYFDIETLEFIKIKYIYIYSNTCKY